MCCMVHKDIYISKYKCMKLSIAKLKILVTSCFGFVLSSNNSAKWYFGGMDLNLKIETLQCRAETHAESLLVGMLHFQ